MSRILLADHSPHAQRMGERILRDEGYEIATVTDGETVLLRLKDLAPDVILADISLPTRNGYEVCEYVKTSGKFPQTRVILTAGPVTAYDETRAQAAGADGFVRKPFEATALLNTLQPMVEKPEAQAAVQAAGAPKPVTGAKPAQIAPPAPPAPRPIDREQVRAAVILALEASMITMIENITDKVVVALEADARTAPPPAKIAAKAAAAAAQPAAPGVPAESKPAPPPAPPEGPVVHVRTPVFRTLS
ncbi:MAG TPA: response regulator [Bryobacteraceae bacterium]|jgi:CheY-like chemotaxis protein|nr:response regulator [Bryobacteraceae bacterium]